MTLQLANDPKPDQIRKWSAPNEYRNKADARVAAICTAIEEGAIEFIRFRGEPPPLGYTSPYSLQNHVPEPSPKSNGKRKVTEDVHTDSDKLAKRYKKAKLEGVQPPHEQPTPKDTPSKKHGKKKKSGSIHTHTAPESSSARAIGVSHGGHISGSYQPGLEGESSSGTAYPMPQGGPSSSDVSMDRASSFPLLMPSQHFTPQSHYSMQGGYPALPHAIAPSSHQYLQPSVGRGASVSTEVLRGDSSEPEPGEVFDVSSGPSGVSDGS
jgi:hypothetical protein